MKKNNLLTIFILVVFTSSYAQNFELISTSGDSFKNENYQIDWSIGEVAIETYTNDSNILTQGLHQSTYTVLAVEDNAIKLNMSVYPNPATDIVNVKAENLDAYQLILSDVNGKQLLVKQVNDGDSLLDLSSYKRATYYLSINKNGKHLKTYKLIKK